MIPKENSGDEPDEELTACSCGPLLYFSIQIDGQRKL